MFLDLSTYEEFDNRVVFHAFTAFNNFSYNVRSFCSLDNDDKQTIKEAANVIAKHTCIRFVERRDQEDYIEFYEDSKYDTYKKKKVWYEELSFVFAD